jgi:hypothetical protein
MKAGTHSYEEHVYGGERDGGWNGLFNDAVSCQDCTASVVDSMEYL